jgi:hypothetical protein
MSSVAPVLVGLRFHVIDTHPTRRQASSIMFRRIGRSSALRSRAS